MNAISLFSKESKEYKRLEAAASFIQAETGQICQVNDIYYDHGLNWLWTTVSMESGLKSFPFMQILTPKLQSAIVYGTMEEWLEAVRMVADKHKGGGTPKTEEKPGRLYVFWRYDLPPYMLGGEVEAVRENGSVDVKGFEGYNVRKDAVRAIMPYEKGAAFHQKLKDAKTEFDLATKKASEKMSSIREEICANSEPLDNL